MAIQEALVINEIMNWQVYRREFAAFLTQDEKNGPEDCGGAQYNERVGILANRIASIEGWFTLLPVDEMIVIQEHLGKGRALPQAAQLINQVYGYTPGDDSLMKLEAMALRRIVAHLNEDFEDEQELINWLNQATY